MAGKTVVVGCKLPNGIILEHPADPASKVTLVGKNKSLIVGADYATTDVSAEWWDAWMAANKGFSAVVAGAIFTAKNPEDAQAIASDLKSQNTGFEPISQSFGGVKPADKE